VPLTAARDLRHDQFVLVGVDERAAGVSGCSVDALVRRMQQLERVLGVELINNGPVLYRDGDEIRRVSRDEFSGLASAGKVTLDTPVFGRRDDDTDRAIISRIGGLCDAGAPTSL
jgi:hypothetical protein